MINQSNYIYFCLIYVYNQFSYIRIRYQISDYPPFLAYNKRESIYI